MPRRRRGCRAARPAGGLVGRGRAVAECAPCRAWRPSPRWARHVRPIPACSIHSLAARFARQPRNRRGDHAVLRPPARTGARGRRYITSIPSCSGAGDADGDETRRCCNPRASRTPSDDRGCPAGPVLAEQFPTLQNTFEHVVNEWDPPSERRARRSRRSTPELDDVARLLRHCMKRAPRALLRGGQAWFVLARLAISILVTAVVRCQ